MSLSTILIADDEPRVLEVLKPSLIAQGYPVLEAQGRDDALQKLPERFDFFFRQLLKTRGAEAQARQHQWRLKRSRTSTATPRKSLFLRCARFLPLQWRELQVGNLPKVGFSVRCCFQFALFDSLDGFRRRNPFLCIDVVDGCLNPERVLLREEPQVLSTDFDFCTNALIQHGRTPKRVAVADFCDRRRRPATCPVCFFVLCSQ